MTRKSALTRLTLVPIFLLSACRLDVSTEGNGVVQSDSGKIECREAQGACQGWYGSAEPETEILVAAADNGHRFVGWSGACSGEAQNCELLIGATSADLEVRAHFQPGQGAVLELQPAAGGVITSSDNRLRCGIECAAGYPAGSEITLTATPLPGYRFNGWVGACAGNEQATCTLVTGSDRSNAAAIFSGSLTSNSEFVNFESGQVRPLALSPDGNLLFATNTPANTLEIYAVSGGQLEFQHSVPVGLEPVAVAAPDNSEVWVVNHLSDSISIVDLDAEVPQVVRTLQVGDEPRDIVFAGPGGNRAFVTTARRGQNTPYPLEEYRTPGLPRADVWVFDRGRDDLMSGGEPLTIVNLFGDVPRALATNDSGSRVYAAVFSSGNQTTSLLMSPEVDIGKAAPQADIHGDRQPATGLIVKYDGAAWRDDAGTDWSDRVRLSLPDYDVFEINANASTPREINRVSGVGTTLFNMAFNPVRQELYVTNTEARNEVRFEGPGTISTTVRGHIADSRISVINRERQVNPVDLNPHVDYSLPQGEAIDPADKALSLAQPVGIAVAPDGERVFIAAMGSNKVAAISADVLSADYQAQQAATVSIPGGGPTGITLDAAGRYLYVLARYNNSIVAVDTTGLSITSTTAMENPEPDLIRQGRPFLYDATLTSSNGTTSCAACHIFGDTDHLAWDLGNPNEEVVSNPLPFTPTGRPDGGATFHPMKGPMTTQTFRGINDSGPMHWRGDRTGTNRVEVNGQLESVEAAAFKEFRGAFVGLLGREEEIDESDLQAFTDFALTLMPPPNPLRALDNSRTPAQQLGEQIYFNEITTGGNLVCNDCHTLNPGQNQFGTGGEVSDEGPGITEDFKVPHFRNLYTKVGMFGLSPGAILRGTPHQGDQVRGFGYLHDGSMDTLDNFFSAIQFNLFNNTERRFAIIDFVMASDSNLAPIVGQQITLDGTGRYAAASLRLDLLIARALAGSDRPECDLVVHGVVGGEQRAAMLREDGYFHFGNPASLPLPIGEIKQLAKQPGRAFTFSCVPPGTAPMQL
ncbi:hypothetical protein EY643_12315 [Halioglobus maricola]|uniref:Bacterial repeat domain-containing protein n=1 Tax=Halioglobus maricola TaxID=2601894 RepID=A0A5P9NKW5_9GAMM|nr:hypothetical protein [Halioglobus maricola]QFU76382.1 hypothetical protein EY643_12315 [Halioglobus maricola]